MSMTRERAEELTMCAGTSLGIPDCEMCAFSQEECGVITQDRVSLARCVLELMGERELSISEAYERDTL